MTGAGKSTLLNTLLLLSEVDESTYGSATHQGSAPTYTVGSNAYPYEALGLVRRLLLKQQPGLSEEALEAAVQARVTITPRAALEETDAAEAAERARMECDVYGRVEAAAFAGTACKPDFVHPTGNTDDATTRVCTANRYGTRYHVCCEMLSETELRQELLAFLRDERQLRAAAGPAVASYRAAVRALPARAKEERHYRFELWNATVAAQCELGVGCEADLRLQRYEGTASEQLPALLTCGAEPSDADIPLHPEAGALLSKFRIAAGCAGNRLHLDRALVRQELARLSGAGAVNAAMTRELYLVKKVWAFGPWALLQGGKELVDAPGTADPTPLHRRQMYDAIPSAEHIIIVCQKNLRINADTLAALRDAGALERFWSSKLTLSIVHNPEALAPGLTNFMARGPAAGETGANISINELAKHLDEALGGPTLDEVKAVVRSRVKVLTMYSQLYAGLKLFPERARSVALPHAMALEEVLAATQGPDLLALLEGLNLARVCEAVEGLRNVLVDAHKGVKLRRSRMRDEGTTTALQQVANYARELRRPNNSTMASMHSALASAFVLPDEDAPKQALATGLSEALTVFDASVRGTFTGDALTAHADSSWAGARPRFVQSAQDALDAYAAAKHAPLLQYPPGMNLQTLLCSMLQVPQAAVDELLRAVDAALADTVDESCALLHDELVRRLTSKLGSAQAALARPVLDDFSAAEGRTYLEGALRKERERLCASAIEAQLVAAKRAALRQELQAHSPTPAPGDQTGVATLVDARRGAVLEAVLANFHGNMTALHTAVLGEVERALRPRMGVEGAGARWTPAMEVYLGGVLEYLTCTAEKDKGRRDVEAAKLEKLHLSCNKAVGRVDAVVRALRGALACARDRGAAAERYIDAVTLFRQLDGAMCRPEQVRQSDLPTPPEGGTVLLLNTRLPQFYQRLGLKGDTAYVSAVRAALAAHEPPLRYVNPIEDVKAPVDDTLWGALCPILFETPLRQHRTDMKDMLRKFTLKCMARHYAVPGRAAEFTKRYGVTVEKYISELSLSSRRPGLLELELVCCFYNITVCVWLADKEGTRLLVYPERSPAARAYHLVLTNERGARACDYRDNVFLPVVRAQPPTPSQKRAAQDAQAGGSGPASKRSRA
jgi:hypothetical protein